MRTDNGSTDSRHNIFLCSLFDETKSEKELQFVDRCRSIFNTIGSIKYYSDKVNIPLVFDDIDRSQAAIILLTKTYVDKLTSEDDVTTKLELVYIKQRLGLNATVVVMLDFEGWADIDIPMVEGSLLETLRNASTVSYYNSGDNFNELQKYSELREIMTEKLQIKPNDGFISLNLEEIIRYTGGNGLASIINQLRSKGKLGSLMSIEYEGLLLIQFAAKDGYLDVIEIIAAMHPDALQIEGKYGWTLLTFACLGGQLHVVKYLVEHGADIEARDEEGQTAIYAATYWCHIPVLRYLLDQNADIDTKDNQGQTVLHCASKWGHQDTVAYLLERDAFVNVKDNEDRYPIHIACTYGHLEIVKLLLDNDSKINRQLRDGKTPLIIASEQGHTELVKYLVNRGADSSICDEHGKSAQHYAAMNGHCKVLKALVGRTMKLAAPDDEGRHVMHVACEFGKLSVVKYLVNNGISVEDKDKQGKSAVHTAAKFNHPSLVRFLLRQGANVNSTDGSGRSSLFSVAEEIGRIDITSLLLDAGADIELADNEGLTVLHLSVMAGNDELVLLLLEKKCRIDASDKLGRTALHCACLAKRVDTVKILLDKKASTDTVDNHGQTTLILASKMGLIATVRHLVENKADVNIRDNDSRAALHHASEAGFLEVVECLISNRADVDARGQNGNTALHLAAVNGHLSIVKCLLDNGAQTFMLNDENHYAVDLAAKSGQTEIVKLLFQLHERDQSRPASVPAKSERPVSMLASFFGSSSNAPSTPTDSPSNTMRRAKTADDAEITQASSNILGMAAAMLTSPRKAKTLDETDAAKLGRLKKSESIKLMVAPLFLAVVSGQLGVVKYLLEQHADVNVTDEEDQSPLILAARYGHDEIVKYLIENKANIAHKDKYSKTALHRAAEIGHATMIEYLLKAGAEVEGENSVGQTPLLLAVGSGHLEAVQVLVKYKADVNVHDHSGRNALDIGAENAFLDIVKFLLDNNANVALADEQGRLPLHICAEAGKLDVVTCLVEKNAEIDPQDKDFRTPLHLACINGHLDVVVYLLQHGAAIDARDKEGKIPIHLAAQHGRTSIVQHLVDIEAILNVVDNEGSLPLHLAAAAGHVDVVRVLLESNSDINAKDSSSSTPIRVAAKNNQEEVVELLLRKAFDIAAHESGHHFESPFKGLIAALPDTVKNWLKSEKRFDQMLNWYFTHASTKYDVLCLDWLLMKNSPIKVLNGWMRPREDGHSHFTRILESRLKSKTHEKFALIYLIRFYCYLLRAAQKNVLQSNDILDIARKTEKAIAEMFSSDCIDDQRNLLAVLHPSNKHTDNEYAALVRESQLFDDDGVISYCIENSVKILFDRAQVAGFVDRLFYSCWRAASQSFLQKEPNFPVHKRAMIYVKYSLNLRTTPVAIFFMEISCRVTTLTLIGIISLYYGKRYRSHYPHTIVEDWTGAEILFAIVLFSQIAHEIGELIDCNFVINEYLGDEWNYLDIVDFSMGLLWFLSRASGAITVARVVLALVAIPEALTMFRFLSINKPLGELVIMIRVMAYELRSFLFVYIVVVVGFAITLIGLFYGDWWFKSPIFTFLTLLEISLAEFQFSMFNSESNVVNGIGIAIEVLFIMMCSIVLINLLIARMTSSHTRVSEFSFREWSYAKAVSVQQRLLWEEANPLCLIPAPLNIVTILCSPIHYLIRHRTEEFPKFTLAGTISNYLFAIIGYPVRVFAMWYSLVITLKELTRSSKDSTFHKFRIAIEHIFLTLTHPIWDLFLIFGSKTNREYLNDYLTEDEILDLAVKGVANEEVDVEGESTRSSHNDTRGVLFTDNDIIRIVKPFRDPAILESELTKRDYRNLSEIDNKLVSLQNAQKYDLLHVQNSLQNDIVNIKNDTKNEIKQTKDDLKNELINFSNDFQNKFESLKKENYYLKNEILENLRKLNQNNSFNNSFYNLQRQGSNRK